MSKGYSRNQNLLWQSHPGRFQSESTGATPLELATTATPAVGKCMEKGLLINATHDTVVRLLPALNITPEQVDEGCETLAGVLREMAHT